ncbi:MAG: mycofactocin precursor MftA [Ilumatobacteraceae bacterium]
MEPIETAVTAEVAIPITPVIASNAQVLVEELLIEEISIDGMCGVY